MDRVTTRFPIIRTVMRVANPLGGGIYMVVPYLANPPLGPPGVAAAADRLRRSGLTANPGALPPFEMTISATV